MSGTFPTDPLPSSMSLKSTQPSLKSTSHSLKDQIRSRGGQRWGFKLAYSKKTRAEMAKLMAFTLKNRGEFGVFDFVPALLSDRQFPSLGTPLAKTAVSLGRQVVVDGWPTTTTVGLAGDFVKFAGHSKVYMLVENAVTNGSGEATLTFEPALYKPVAADEAVIMDNVPFKMRFASDSPEWPLEAPKIFSYELELIEVLP